MRLRSISATSYNTYNMCPYKWLLKYDRHFLTMPNQNFVVGTAFHKGVELYHQYIPVGSILKTLREDLLNGKDTTKDEINRYGLVRQMVEAYVRNPVTLPTIETEYRFNFKVPSLSVPLYGVVDRVVEGGLVEYKTSAKDFKFEDIDNIQTDIYSFAYKNRFGSMPLVTYCILNKKKSKKPDYRPQILEIKREESHMEELLRKLKAFEEKVANDEFPPCPDIHCKYMCEYSGLGCKYSKYGS